MNNIISCLVCGVQKSNFLYPGILKCSQCGYIFADLNLTQLDFEALYQVNYFHGDEYSDYKADEAIIKKNFRSRLKILLPFCGKSQIIDLLEVGSAYGFFLELAKPHFKSVIGIDITKDGVEYTKERLGIEAVKMDLENWDFKNRKYDVVFFGIP